MAPTNSPTSPTTVLEQISEAVGPVLEQLERVESVGVLREHNHSHVGAFGSDLSGGDDALGFVVRWHPNVDHHGVVTESVHGLVQVRGIAHGCHHLDLAGGLEELTCPFPEEVVVFSDHGADRPCHDETSRPVAIGSSAARTVPRSGRLSTVIRPPAARIRSDRR
jgi:hypothetical protein